jgi:hypothetical protein
VEHAVRVTVVKRQILPEVASSPLVAGIRSTSACKAPLSHSTQRACGAAMADAPPNTDAEKLSANAARQTAKDIKDSTG